MAAVLLDQDIAIGIEEGEDAVRIQSRHLCGPHFHDTVFPGHGELRHVHFFRIDQFRKRLVIRRFEAHADGIFQQRLQHQRSVFRRDAHLFPCASGEQQDARQQDGNSFHGQKVFVMVRTPAERGSTWSVTAPSLKAGDACRSLTACLSSMLFAAVREPGA